MRPFLTTANPPMTSFARRIRSLLPAFALGFALSLAAVPPAAAATDYTDIWWNAAESGWGVNFVQSDQFMFATFFVFGQGGTPTWYTGQLNRDGAPRRGRSRAARRDGPTCAHCARRVKLRANFCFHLLKNRHMPLDPREPASECAALRLPPPFEFQ